MKSMSVYTCHNANNLNYLIVFIRFNFLYDVSSDINNEIVDFLEASVIDTNKKKKKPTKDCFNSSKNEFFASYTYLHNLANFYKN